MAREHAAALAAKDGEAERKVAQAAGEWRRQLDDAHTRFAEERAKLTAEQRRRMADVEADAARRIAVRLAADTMSPRHRHSFARVLQPCKHRALVQTR